MTNRAEFRSDLQSHLEELGEVPVINPDSVLAMFKGYDAKKETLGKVGDHHVRLVQSELTGGIAVVVAEFEGSEPVMEEIDIDGEVKFRQRRSDDGRSMSRTNWSLVGRKRFTDADEARAWGRDLIQAWKATLHEVEVGEGDCDLGGEPVGGADI